MIGKKLRAYEITEEIGAGGMATVFRAYQPSMDRHVAIKVIRSSILHDQGLRERFQREARLIARLEHPHLLPVYDFDGESDPPYIVMRYLEGGTLKQVQERGGVPRDEILHVLRQLAGALDYAHRQGIVHRDLKPSNIMIDREGNAFLTDFGIARASGGGKDLTGTGLMIGTPGYMAPEQARGDGQADKAADIYSLGVLAFEALTGAPPYDHESGFEVILAHMNSPIPKASERNPEVPKAADAVLARALAKQPVDRFPTATEFVDALARGLKIKPSASPGTLQSMTQTISVDQLAKLAASKGERETPGTGTPSEQQRQMTAVAVDVKELAEILYESGADNERVRATVNALWASFGEIAKEAGGIIHSRTDDAGLILWGRERAREDDSENAIRAALLMHERTLDESRKVLGATWEPTEENPLPFVAGITTGPVLLERESSGSYTASGAPITLAARLKEAAPPGGILTAHETFTLVRGVFTFLPQDALRVRGRKEPIEVYLVTNVKPRAFRLRAMGIEGVETKMIGREIELRLLQEAMSLTLEDGETQVVTVVGEAGVGKSRLLYEFRNWIELQEQVVWIFQARATQPSMPQPYSLARDLFSFRFRILDSDPLAQVHQKFVEGVAEFMGSGSEKKAHYIGQLVGFDFTGIPEVAAALQDGETFRRTAQDFLGEFFTTASRANPVMIYIEDIHWADDRSLDLLNSLVRDNTELPLFVLCMARPSFYERRPQWGEGQRFHERIQLEPLSQLSSRRFVRELLKHVSEVPTALRDLVVDRADGNPFYIEELIKALIDDRVIVKGDPDWSVDSTRLSTVRIPATLTGVLQARLDTLPPALYQLLQRASVIGRIFWGAAAIRLSQEPAGLEPAEVQAMLEELRDREMILQREESGFAGTVEYVFRHAILRDVTYETVIPRQRRALHRMVGDWLIEVGGERADEHTLLVAEHYSRAEEVSLAAAQLMKVGERGVRVATYDEASTVLQRAREMLTSKEHVEQRLQIDLLRGDIESFRGSYTKAGEIFRPILEEVRAIGNLPLLAQTLGKLGRIALWQQDFPQSMKYLEEAITISRGLGDEKTLMFNLRQIGNVLVELDGERSIRHLEESVAIARKLGDRISEGSGLNSLGNVFLVAGRIDETRDAYVRAIEAHKAAGDRFGTAMVMGNLGGLYVSQNDLDLGERYVQESLSLARELRVPALVMDGQTNLASIHLRRGRDQEAHALLKEIVRAAREVGLPPKVYPLFHGVIRIRAGDRAKGLAWVGYSRAHYPNTFEVKMLMGLFADAIRGNDSEEDLERALKAGEGLKLDEILEEAERQAP